MCVRACVSESFHTYPRTYIKGHEEASATVSGSLLLSNWHCRRVQRMIYTTTSAVSPLQEYSGREADDGVALNECGRKGMKGIAQESRKRGRVSEWRMNKK